MNNFYLKTALIFCGALLCISLYYIIFSVAIGGDWRLYGNLGDFVNMTSFAFIGTALALSVSRFRARQNIPFVAALGILTIIMILIISINRYLAVYPDSSAFNLFFYIGIMDFIVACILPVGVARMAGFISNQANK